MGTMMMMMMMVRSWDSDDDDDGGDNGGDGNHDSDIEDDGGDHGDDIYGDGDIDNGRVAEVKGIKFFSIIFYKPYLDQCTISPYNPKLTISCKNLQICAPKALMDFLWSTKVHNRLTMPSLLW